MFKKRHEKIEVKCMQKKIRNRNIVREKNLRENTLNTREGTIAILVKVKILLGRKTFCTEKCFIELKIILQPIWQNKTYKVLTN